MRAGSRSRGMGRMSIGDKLSYGMRTLGGIGLSRTQAYGVMGSLMGESGKGLNENAHNPNDPGPLGARGIAQWNQGRLAALKSFAAKKGTTWNNFKTQMDFVAHELTTTEKAAYNRVKNATTVEQATKGFTFGYERPNAKYANLAGRIQHAKAVQNMFRATPDMVSVDASFADPVASTATGIGETVQSIASNPFGAIADMLSGKVNVGQQIDDALGPVDEVAKGAFGVVTGKDPIGGVKGIAEALAGDDPNSPLGAIAGFLDPTPGMKLGAIAGGIIGGPQGSLIGGLIGQGLGLMLGSFMNNQQQQQQQQNTGLLGTLGFDDYPTAPQQTANRNRGYGSGSGYGYGSLGDYGRGVYGGSGQFGGAVDSGTGGLW